jgi:hypothetical protein
VSLASAWATASASGTVISCARRSATGTLPMSMAVIQQTAVSDGVSVARYHDRQPFPSDPIGTVTRSVQAGH